MSTDLQTWFEIAKVAVAALTPLSIFVAYKAYKANLSKQAEDRVRDADRELVAQAQKSLEWAYNALTVDGSSFPPPADRLNWLTCARHLLRHRKLAERIRSETYRTVHAEHEEYWRHRFYCALNDRSLAGSAYFDKPGTSMNAWTENIEISSALVVVQFSNWPKGMPDPTDSVNREEILKDEQALVGHAGRGLRTYILRLEESRKNQVMSE